MRKIKTSQEVSGSPEMKVVSLQNNHAQIEIEIDRHVKSIQCLIRRLTPADRHDPEKWEPVFGPDHARRRWMV